MVVKSHASADEEGRYCQTLGRDVAPAVHSVERGAYTMEYLEPAERVPELIQEMETKLRKRVWCRSLPMTYRDTNWPVLLFGRTELRVPAYVTDIPRVCMTHGDCTVGNAMRRASGSLVIADPVCPRLHVARHAEADMGRLLQSAAGWETVAYGDDPVEWLMPQFWRDKSVRRRALWWCGATARRILVDWRNRGRITPQVEAWCVATQERCHSAADV